MVVMEKSIKGLCIFSALILLFIVITACTGTAPVQPASLGTERTPPGQTLSPITTAEGNSTGIIADANNQFAFSLYSVLAKDRDYAGRNLFFSPFSLSSAFAITSEGARGKTADEIRSVFHFPENDTVLRSGFSGLDAIFSSSDTAYSLRTANALWAEKTYPFLPEYVSTVEHSYGAKTTNLDFINHAEESRNVINTWVENRTENRIRDLIPPGVIDPMTRLVITNAIYFRGDWVKQFDKNQTTDTDFRTAAGTAVKVPMMQRTDEEAQYRYAENNDLQMLSMPYGHTTGNQLSMIVLLPRSDNLSVTETSLNSGMLSALQQSATLRRVIVYFPKFTLETKYSLPGMLKGMGMPIAFSSSADFSGMDGSRNLSISDVIHQAYIDTDEKGTEAAAATAVVMVAMAAPFGHTEEIPVFRADHPFIFLIQEDKTGAIVFMGRVVNPAGS